MEDVVLAIDIGGTNTAFGLVDKEGNILTREKLPTIPLQPATKLFERLFQAFSKMYIKEKYRLCGIGIGAPNANYYNGTIEYPTNLKWGFVKVADIVEKYYNTPLSITNDANAAALGEMKYGIAKNMRNFIMITLGTGLGSGIIANGKLIYGSDGFAGEMGHVQVEDFDRICGCGRTNCLETIVSATGIKRTVYELIAKYNTESTLSDIPISQLTAKHIYNAAIKGDEIAKEAFEVTGKVLGKAIANATIFFSPEAIILFGGLASAKEWIVNPTKYHMEANMMPVYKNKVKLLLSDLPEGDAAILGAAALIWDRLDAL